LKNLENVDSTNVNLIDMIIRLGRIYDINRDDIKKFFDKKNSDSIKPFKIKL